MSGSLRRTIEDLLENKDHLPTLCNVLARVLEPPKRVGGGKWVFGVEGLSGNVRAIIAIHEKPPIGLSLGYDQTTPELLQIMAEDKLRSLLVPGETVLAQAVPRYGTDGLWLNIQAILLVRPHRLFGRSQIDLASGCPRRSYLAIAKAVHSNSRGILNKGNVSGTVIHEIFSAWASGGYQIELPGEDIFSPGTLVDLIYLGVKSERELSEVLQQPERLNVTVNASAILRGILQEGPWEVESPVLNNGVAASPDLLRNGAVVEVKYISKGSKYFDKQTHLRQVEAYIAWAMVEFGLPVVLQTWKGMLVHLHPSVPEEDRVISVSPRMDILGCRIVRRHRLLALHSGHWLPKPDTDCEYCDFCGRNDLEGTEAPPSCQFYCQTERSWPCSSDVAECPLINKCDQRYRWFDFNKLDRTNASRIVLTAEEEEREIVESVVESLAWSGASSRTGLVFSDFIVADNVRGRLRLIIPEWAKVFEFAAPEEAFSVLSGDRVIGVAKYIKRRENVMIFRFARHQLVPLESGDKVSLRITVGWNSRPRDVLSFLDRAQRLGTTEYGQSGSVESRRNIQNVDELPPYESAADLTLVDVLGLSSVRDIVIDVIEWGRRGGVDRIVVIGGEQLGLSHIQDTVLLDEVGVYEIVESHQGSFAQKVVEAAARVRAAKILFVPASDLMSTRLDTINYEGNKLPLIVVAEADCLPLALIVRCIELAERVVLVGQSFRSGPWVECSEARRSEVYQNAFALLQAGAIHSIPTTVSRIDVYRRKPSTSLDGMKNLDWQVGINSVPIEWSITAEATNTICAPKDCISLQTYIPATGNIKEIEVEFYGKERIATKTIRTLIRGISIVQIGALGAGDVGKSNKGLLGHPVLIRKVDTFLPSPERSSHVIRVNIPANGFRFVQERSHHNKVEAVRAIEYIKMSRQEMFIVTSPFFAQCELLARLLTEAEIRNARVVPLDQLGRKSLGTSPRALVVSWVVGSAHPSFPSPLDDVGRLIEILYGGWTRAVFFATQEVVNHHPLLRNLYKGSNHRV